MENSDSDLDILSEDDDGWEIDSHLPESLFEIYVLQVTFQLIRGICIIRYAV